MKTLNLFSVLIVMALFTASCAPGIKLTNGKKVTGNIGTNYADMEGLSKAEMRVANAGLTHSVATMIDSASKNPDKYREWKTIIVALTELTKNPDEKIITINRNQNKSSLTGELARGRSSNYSKRYNSSGHKNFPGFSYNLKNNRYYWDKYDPQHKYPIPISFVKMINEEPKGDLAQSVKSSIANKY